MTETSTADGDRTTTGDAPAHPLVSELLDRLAASAEAERRPLLHRPLHELLTRGLADESFAQLGCGASWTRFLHWLDKLGDRLVCEQAAAGAALLAVVVYGEASDYETVADLVDEMGFDRLAHLQQSCESIIEASRALEVTTAAIRRLLSPALATILRGAGLPDERVDAVVERCGGSAKRLLVRGLNLTDAAPAVRTVEQLREAARGTLPDWRREIAVLVVNPWSPYAEQLPSLAFDADAPGMAGHIRDVVELCRAQHKDREREEVAQEIRRLVAASDMTQREFAALVGTSPSRLSTYISGWVVPSAAMLLRISRVSRSLRAQRGESTLAVPLYDALRDTDE